MGDSTLATGERLASACAVYETGESMKAEIERRLSRVDRLEAFFRSRPLGEWIPASELEEPGGRQAWRTRASQLRLRLERANEGTIENRVDRDVAGRIIASYYRLLTHVPLGRDAGTPILRGWTQDGPYQEPFRLTAPKA